MSEYEKLRRKNIEDNKRILAELGLANILPKSRKITFKKNKLPTKVTSPKPKPTPKRKLEIEEEELGSIRKRRRRSARIQGKEADALALEDEGSEEEEDEDVKPSNKVVRPNSYGAIEGVEVGDTWLMRIDCSRDGIHRPTVAGIHGGPEGAYSIALSGGYDDNIDLGEGFTYTGEGGRDLKGTKANPKNLRTAPQSKDQTLTRGNLALSRNVETKHPVRVIRGYKLDSPFAPEEGYRYDGLYSVEKCWFTTGLSGFGVWKFALKRCPDQAPPPWSLNESFSGDESTGNQSSSPKTDICKEEDKQIKKEVGHEDATKDKDIQRDEASIQTDLLKENTTSCSNIEENAVEDDSKKKEVDTVEAIKSTDNLSGSETTPENCVVSDEKDSCKENASANKENEENDPSKTDNDLKTVESETKVVKPGQSGILTENESKIGGPVTGVLPAEAKKVPLSEDNPER